MSWPLVTVDSIKAKVPYACVGGPFGSNLTSKHYVDEGVPVIRGQNLSGSNQFNEEGFVFVSAEKAEALRPNTANRGDVIFTQRGTLGQVGLIPSESNYERYIVSQSQMKLTVDSARVDARYIYQYFRLPSTVQAILNRTITAGVPHINLGILKALELPLPPLNIQRRISDVSQNYDDLIETNRRRIALLEESARLLYREWFVNLRFPGHELAKWQDGLPEGWEKTELSEVASIVMGQSPESKHYNKDGQGLPFHQGVSDFEGHFVAHRIYTTHATRTANAGDILCSVRAPVGRLNLTREDIAIGRGLSAIRSRNNQQGLLLHQLKALFVEEDMIGGGTIFSSVGKKELFSQQVLQPSPEVASKFDNLVGQVVSHIEVLTVKNRLLAITRDELLPKLMSGTIRV